MRSGKHEMIDQCAADALRRARQSPRGEAVGNAGSRIAAGMVVGEKDSRGGVQCCVCDDWADRERAARLIAFVTEQVNAVPVGIDVRDPQALPSGIGLCEALGEERAGRFQSVQHERLCGTLTAHPTQLCGQPVRFDSNRIPSRLDFIHNGENHRLGEETEPD